MAPVKNKRCCVPHCPNADGGDGKKQFFRMGANLASRDKFRVGKLIIPNSAILYCCEDHFDLPNDALNYIRYKYQPGTKLKLRSNLIPHKRLPVNVCRLCLNLIYDEDSIVDISEETGSSCAKIVTELLPSIDLSVTIDPVACLKCFNPLKETYGIKKNELDNEMVVINCLKSVIRKTEKKFDTFIQIDLFDEYNEIKDLIKQNKEEEDTNSSTESEDNIEMDDDVEDQLKEDEAQLEENEDELEKNENQLNLNDQIKENRDQVKENEDQLEDNEDQHIVSTSSEKNSDMSNAIQGDSFLTDDMF